MRFDSIREVRRIGHSDEQKSGKKGWQLPHTNNESKKLFISDQCMISSFPHGLLMYNLGKVHNGVEEMIKTDTFNEINDLLQNTVHCTSIMENPLCIVTTNDNLVILGKWDYLQENWDSKVIAIELGRLCCCSILYVAHKIFIILSKSDEIIVIRVSVENDMLTNGPLQVTAIEKWCTIEKPKAPVAWGKAFFIDEILYFIEITSGSFATIKMWKIDTKMRSIALIDCYANSSCRGFVEADILDEPPYILTMADSSDQIFLFSLHENKLKMFSRFPLEDYFGPPSEEKVGLMTPRSRSIDQVPPQIDIEFKILSMKLLGPSSYNNNSLTTAEEKCTVVKDHENPLDKLLASDTTESSDKLCCELLIIFSTTTGIFFVNGKSGEIIIALKYEEIGLPIMGSIKKAALGWVLEERKVLVALEPMFLRYSYISKFSVCFDGDSTYPADKCVSLLSSHIPSDGSVLTKKLKSPPISKTNMLMRRSPIQNIFSSRNLLLFPRSSKPSESLSFPSKTVKRDHPRGFKSFAPLLSSGCTKSDQIDGSVLGKFYYENEYSFEDAALVRLSDELSQGMNSIRMKCDKTGCRLAVGGNLDLAAIFKTTKFEKIYTIRDIGKVTSLDLSFSNSYLLAGSNDCCTRLYDWFRGKQLTEIRFKSKFNQHIHTQFYYLDQFILQPEENNICLYAFKYGRGKMIYKKAGNFTLAGQTISALAAPNQFYSCKIVAALSNKNIQVFDSNAEKACLTISSSHMKPPHVIRINEAPIGNNTHFLTDMVLTASSSPLDSIKLWDLRTARCEIRISDVNERLFVSQSRPNISPSGTFIATGIEENSVSLYDVRKINSKILMIKSMKSNVLDCCFHPDSPKLWLGCADGSIWMYSNEII